MKALIKYSVLSGHYNKLINIVYKEEAMGNLKRYLVVISVFALTVIWSLIIIASAAAEDLGPYKFRCEDGRVFTITFIKEKGEATPQTAHLVFQKTNATELLTIDLTASGISYSNKNYTYREHQGVSYLIDKTKSKPVNIPCQQY